MTAAPASPSGATGTSGAGPAAAPRSTRTRRMLRMLRRPAPLVGLVIVVAFVAVAVLAPYIVPHDPIRTDWLQIRKPPSEAYWFGTDELGRDVLSRLLVGARASLLAGVLSVAIAMAVGVPLGLVAGYAGGLVDGAISRFADAMLACPFLILAIAFAAFLGPSLTNAMIAIGLSATPIFIRLTRGQVLAVKTEDYVEAARSVGNPHHRILLRHILPNIVPALIVQATLTIATAIIAESALSFLGVGQQPPAPSWGSMLSAARGFLVQAPWMSIYPGLAICIVVYAFNLLGDGLRDVLDPKEG